MDKGECAGLYRHEGKESVCFWVKTALNAELLLTLTKKAPKIRELF